MRYRLPNDLPVVPASDHTLRLDPAGAERRVEDSRAAERMVTVLRGGADPSALVAIARDERLEPAHAETLISVLLAAARPLPAEAAAPLRVAVRAPGHGRDFATLIAREAGRRGMQSAVGGADAVPEGFDLVLDLADHHVPPHRAAALVAADLPHLPVVRTHEGVRIGPFVHPGRTPCLRCGDLTRRDADPHWPLVAARLGALPPPASRREVELIAALELGLLLESLADTRRATGEWPSGPLRPTVRWDLEVSSPPPCFHPGCGCRALPENATVPLPAAPETSEARAAYALG